jgi:hypothetical protein
VPNPASVVGEQVERQIEPENAPCENTAVQAHDDGEDGIVGTSRLDCALPSEE